MSLNVTIATDRYVLQVVDLRLSLVDTSPAVRQPYTDQSVKCTLVACRDARILLAYHGLGEIDYLRTNTWLAKQFEDVPLPATTFDEFVRLLVDKATNWHRRLRRRRPNMDNRHTFVLSGFGRGNRAFIGLVSNYEKYCECSYLKAVNSFGSTGLYLHQHGNTRSHVFVGGRSAAVAAEDFQLLDRLANDPGVKTHDMTNVAVGVLRRAAGRCTQISPHCTIALMARHRMSVECNYLDDQRITSFLPNVLGTTMIANAVVTTGDIVPPWEITGRLKSESDRNTILRDVRRLPKDYFTGGAINVDIDDRTRAFLSALPPKVHKAYVEYCLSNREKYP